MTEDYEADDGNTLSNTMTQSQRYQGNHALFANSAATSAEPKIKRKSTHIKKDAPNTLFVSKKYDVRKMVGSSHNNRLFLRG